MNTQEIADWLVQLCRDGKTKRLLTNYMPTILLAESQKAPTWS